MKKILLGLAVALVVAGGLSLYGSSFTTKTVHDQLAAQKIYFPKDKASGLYDDLKQYAGQPVDNGAKAKAYADKFIARHLKDTADGKTYAEVSAAARQNPQDQKLAAARQSLFMGETLRGLLLNAWGWGLIGVIAGYAGAGMLVAGGLSLLAAYRFPQGKDKNRR